jgi:hypothetical protein
MEKPSFERQHDNTEVSPYVTILMAFIQDRQVKEVGAFEIQ